MFPLRDVLARVVPREKSRLPRAARQRGRTASHRPLHLETLETRALLSAAPWASAAIVGPTSWTEGHIVVFNDHVDARAVAHGLGQAHGFQPGWVFEHALKGVYIPVDLPDAALTALARNPQVKYVGSNHVTAADFGELTANSEQELGQVTPTGVMRSNVHLATSIDGVDDATPVTVAVLDTGIDPQHPDLKISHELSLGWYRIATGPPSQRGWHASNDPQWWADSYVSHGTPVAGIIGAIDNDRDVVGVAEGATLAAVKISDSSSIPEWRLIAGIDHVAAHADEIAVANMSFGVTPTQAINDAIENLIDRGVVVVAAAMNRSTDVLTTTPQILDRVIVVSAIHDSDGLPGGLGPSSPYGPDDTLASYSNYGPRIDIAAPGPTS